MTKHSVSNCAKCLILFCWVCGLAPTAFGQETESHSASIIHEIQTQLRSNSNSTLDWEGVFTQNFGLHGRTLYIFKDRYAEDSKLDDFGTVSIEKDQLTLTSAAARHGVGQQFAVIRWSSRIYLIEDDRLISFVNAVNMGDEPCEGAPGKFFVRIDRLDRPIDAKPKLPKKFERLLLDKPIDGRVVNILGNRQRIKVGGYDSSFDGREIELLLADQQRAYVGMKLIPKEKGKVYVAIVIDVAGAAIKAIVPDNFAPVGAPENGDVLTSRRAALSN